MTEAEREREPIALRNAGEQAKRPRLSAVLVIIGVSLWLFLSSWIADLIDQSSDFDTYGFALQCFVFVSSFTMMGLAGVVPLLWLQSTGLRGVAAVLLPLAAWLLFIAGFLLVGDRMITSGKRLAEATSILMLGIVGGIVPAGTVIWWHRWRLNRDGCDQLARPIGIGDLFAFVTAGAIIFAFHRVSGLYDSESSIEASLILFALLFYTLAGMIVTACLLLAIRIFLVAPRHRFAPAVLAGIVISITATVLLWVLLTMAQGEIWANGSIIWQISTMSLSCWGAAALSSMLVCWGLRHAGFRLATRNLSSESNDSPATQEGPGVASGTGTGTGTGTAEQ